MSSTLIRGANPLWTVPTLVGQFMDDTYYLFTLQNTLPYLPSPVWQDPDGNVQWSDPIEVLSSGNLPGNIYFDPSIVYRLEWRAGPTQSDALIWLVENYVPGADISPVGTGANITDNQITNPQFALVAFDPTSSLTISTATTTYIAPGWSVITSGSGTLTVSQAQFTGTSNVPGNASYGITLTNAGFTKVTLVQQFNLNGELWTQSSAGNDGAVSLNVVALTSAGIIPITGTIAYSDGQSQQVFDANVNVAANIYGNAVSMPQSTNSATPANSYTQCLLSFGSSGTITFTNIQLIGEYTPLEIPYLQTTIERQIDQTYHLALPIVPVGAILDYVGFVAPNNFLLCDGSAISRNTYYKLLSVLTTSHTVTLNSSTSYTDANAAVLYIGMSIEGPYIPASTTISNISGTTITISNAATFTGSSTVTYFASGNGDGSTTFNIPNLLGYVVAGAGGSLFGSGYNGIGYQNLTSTSTVALSVSNLPPHSHGVPLGISGSSVSGPGTFNPINTGPTSTNSTPGAASTPFSVVQPTFNAYKYIRYE